MRTIDWKPFSQKHKEYIRRALKCRMSVAEGAIRSGKTIDHCIISAIYLETCKDKIHLASGSTIGNAKLNIGACNGYGLENLFKGRCHWGKYKGNEALIIQTQTGEKVVIFAGGGKADSYKKILGNSYGLWIATEINEHYDSDDPRTSFIKVAFGRQVASEQPMVLWDLNPSSPAHPIYEEYIDAYQDRYLGGYNYEHFTMQDNLSITAERQKEIASQYIEGSIWYRRDILGERCIAEGLIYPMYEDVKCDIDKIRAEWAENKPQNAVFSEFYDDVVLSIDYGTQNAFACILWGKHKDIWYAYDGYYYSGRKEGHQKTDEDYADDIDLLTDNIKLEYGRKIEVIIDPSASSMKATLRRRNRYKVRDADNSVLDGIRETATAMQKGLIKIDSDLKDLWDEIGGYIWDDRNGEDKPIKENDHYMDAMRYFVKTKHIVRKGARNDL